MKKSETDTFVLTEDHIKLLRHMYVGWQDCETGAPEIDPKRPYGDSGVEYSMREILGIKIDEEDDCAREQSDAEMFELHRETEIALQIILFTGEFKIGTYKKRDRYDTQVWDWWSDNVKRPTNDLAKIAKEKQKISWQQQIDSYNAQKKYYTDLIEAANKQINYVEGLIKEIE